MLSIGTLAAEFVAAKSGLAFFIMFSSFFKIPTALAGLVVPLAVGLILPKWQR